ncbi:peptidoglycan-binding domain-containing protein [Streptomyces sp. OR43]|uniref:peptidoglycan-binding domain-containing protein n=2 Tax=Streptomyces sp. or43 TaxID=2478957 RepID=UPI0021C7EE51|nr:hypothetical protein [Streptomyces sp. or43]
MPVGVRAWLRSAGLGAPRIATQSAASWASVRGYGNDLRGHHPVRPRPGTRRQRTQNWLRIQSGYTGPIDGVPGPRTYTALQLNMRNWGYTGPLDGVPGTNTWAAVQRLSAAHGYTGPIDGVMGPNSWRGFSRFINQDQWD